MARRNGEKHAVKTRPVRVRASHQRMMAEVIPPSMLGQVAGGAEGSYIQTAPPTPVNPPVG
jgi:hypothetical protein